MKKHTDTSLGHCTACTNPRSEGTHQMNTVEHPGPPLVKSAVPISPARLAYLEACEREADAANTWEIAWDNDAENVNEKWRDYQKARTARDAARSKL